VRNWLEKFPVRCSDAATVQLGIASVQKDLLEPSEQTGLALVDEKI
jgi:hypothetical protein